MLSVGLSVAVTDGRGRAVRAPGLAAWLARVAPRQAHGELAIAIVSDGAIRLLNRQYRRKDVPTDVLSFPSTPLPSPRKPPQHLEHPTHLKHPAHPEHPEHLSHPAHPAHPEQPALGDIVIATGVARRQARAAGHSYATELKVLALHGLLHLLGYDHHAASDRGRMVRLERRLRVKGGLREGLIERARAAGEPRKRRAKATRRAKGRPGESERPRPSERR